MSEQINIDLPKESASLRLKSDDLEWCDRVLADARREHSAPSDGSLRRRHVLFELMRRLQAQKWFWCFSSIETDQFVPTTRAFDHSGHITVEESILFARHCQSDGKDLPPENEEFQPLTLRGRHFTRTIHGMETGWSDSQRKRQREFARRIGNDDILYSIRPIELNENVWTFSGAGFARLVGEPSFTPYEVRLAHVATGTWSCVHEPPRRAMSLAAAKGINRSVRPIIAVIYAGFAAKEVIVEYSKQSGVHPKSIARYFREFWRKEAPPAP